MSEPIPAAALPLLRLRVHGEVRPGAASLQTVDATGAHPLAAGARDRVPTA